MIGIGATSVDYVYRLPVLPEADGPQAKIRISSHRISCGGQTATALATCAALGLRAKFAGVLGSDDNGARIRAELMRRGIDVADAVVHQGLNQFAAILVDERTGERIVLWSRDEGLALRPNELSPELLSSAHIVHVDDVDQEGAIRAAERARGVGRDRDERHRSRHRSHRGAGAGGDDPDPRRARAAGDHRRVRHGAGAAQAAGAERDARVRDARPIRAR